MKLFPLVAVALLVFAGTADAQRPERPERQRPERQRERPPAVDVSPVAECDEAAVLNPDGQVIFPVGATDIGASELVDELRGPLSTLYPELDTTTDGFYADLPCDPSIGGTLPTIPPPSQDEIDAEAFLASEIPGIIERLPRDPATELRPWDMFQVEDCSVISPQAGRWDAVSCTDPVFLSAGQPFEGRDIIFVHGLELKDLKDKIRNPPGSTSPPHPANAVWPHDESEFLDPTGYFRVSAEHYWNNHLREHLFDPDSPANPNAGWQFSAADNQPRYQPKANRYLLIAWSSNQTLEYAQHALLYQIMLAMRDGRNVVTPPTYPSKSQSRPFCANGCIIVSHSTGSLIINTAMARARMGEFGDGAEQVRRGVIAHVAFDGATSGSRLAEIAMAVAMRGADAINQAVLLCNIVDQTFDMSGTCKNADLSFVGTSILRDLIPQISQGVWGPVSNKSPVPTVTFAGATPRGNQAGGLTKIFLPGVDDGVETMNSACGNPNPVFPGSYGDPGVNPPSGVRVASLVKAFEFSEDPGVLARSVRTFMSQHNHLTSGIGVSDPRYLAGTCAPHLSPTGMVMLVEDAFAGTQRDARARFANHYSFIMSLGEHSYDGGGDPANSWPSSISALPGALRQYWPDATINREESVVVTDGTIYTRMIDTNGTRLVKPVAMDEIVRGRKVGFKLFGKRYTWWLWKRTYHLAHRWQEMQSSHYAYEFVARR